MPLSFFRVAATDRVAGGRARHTQSRAIHVMTEAESKLKERSSTVPPSLFVILIQRARARAERDLSTQLSA